MEFLIPLFSAGSLFMLFVSVILLLVVFARVLQPKNKQVQNVATTISKNAILITFLATAAATLGSLYLSEITKFAPCKLCWYQRIFMYPQVIVLGIGYFINDLKVRIYALVLSIIGLLIAIYHILVQFFPGVFQCSDEVAECAVTQFVYFGFITIPVMSAITFGFIITVLLFTFLPQKQK